MATAGRDVSFLIVGGMCGRHSAGKDGGEVEPKRSSARPRKRPSSAAGLDSSEPLLLDAWAQPSSGPPLARSKITSPPSLVWESQPLYQVSATMPCVPWMSIDPQPVRIELFLLYSSQFGDIRVVDIMLRNV